MRHINDSVIYRKTEAGLEEMRSRRLGLPRKTFLLLLAIDGQRSREQLCSSLSAFGDVSAQLDQLVLDGLIVDPDPVDAMPAAEPDTAMLVADTLRLPEPPIETLRQSTIEPPPWWTDAHTAARTASPPQLDASTLLETGNFEKSQYESSAYDAGRVGHDTVRSGTVRNDNPDDMSATASVSLHTSAGSAPVAGDLDVSRYEQMPSRIGGMQRAKALMEATLVPQSGLSSLDLRIAVEQCRQPGDLRRLLPEYAGVVARHLSQVEFQRHIVDVLSALDTDRQEA